MTNHDLLKPGEIIRCIAVGGFMKLQYGDIALVIRQYYNHRANRYEMDFLWKGTVTVGWNARPNKVYDLWERVNMVTCGRENVYDGHR